jgi:hypothetical protein
MRKISLLASLTGISMAANATDGSLTDEGIRQIVINTTAIIVIYLASSFILKAVKSFHDYRLKDKMIEKGVPDSVVEQFLKTPVDDTKNQTIKWFFILMSLGAGLSFIGYYNPPFIPTAAIMSFSIAGSFLAFFIYIKLTSK